jgi:hypothetical protein
MATIKTQFMMSGVRTYVTVEDLGENRYGCTLNLVDFYEGDEVPTNPTEHDLTATMLDNGTWQQVGDSKVHLNPEDLQGLGKAISELERS